MLLKVSLQIISLKYLGHNPLSSFLDHPTPGGLTLVIQPGDPLVLGSPGLIWEKVGTTCMRPLFSATTQTVWCGHRGPREQEGQIYTGPHAGKLPGGA